MNTEPSRPDRARRLRADRRGVAALEFALLAPALVVIVLGLYDISKAVIVWWQLSAAAGAIARIGTTYAATPDNTNVLSTTQAASASTAIFAVIPALAQGPSSRYGVTMTSVVMTPTVPGCSSNCTYLSNTAWSLALQGAAPLRPCGSPGQVADGTPSSSLTLPLDAFTRAPLLVVDVTYDFIPLFNTFFGHALTFMETAYLATRTGNDAAWIRLTGPQAAQAQCPGYTG